MLLGLEIGSWADWLAAGGTIGAVFFAVKNRTDKAKIVLSASYTQEVQFEHDILSMEEEFDGSPKPVYSAKTNGQIYNVYTNLRIYFTNYRQSGGLVTSWGIIDSNKKEKEISSEPIFVKGFDVIEIKHTTELEPGCDFDFVIDEVEKSIKKFGHCKCYFKDINNKKQYYVMKKKESSNKTD
ncbi:MAG: hypothetical protein ABF445_02860 [Leuconostoc mesenteroides]